MLYQSACLQYHPQQAVQKARKLCDCILTLQAEDWKTVSMAEADVVYNS